MKLAHKFTFAFLLATLPILVARGYYFGTAYIDRRDHDSREDMAAMAETFSLAASGLWDARGERAASAMVEAAHASSLGTSLRWVSLQDESVPDSIRASLTAGQKVEVIDERQSVVRLFVPVYYQSKPAAGIELRHSLLGYRQSASEIVSQLVWASVLSMLVYAAVALLVSKELVSRPVQRLIDLARRVAAGDLSHRVRTNQRDELSRLADEMNRMCDELAVAREKVVTESAARVRAVEQLRHADRLNTVGKLAAGVAHELGTPLNVISGRASMIAAGEAVDKEAVEYAEIIVAQADRMTRIIRQLLAFARRQSTDREPVDLVGVVFDAADLLSPIAKKQRADIQVVANGGAVQAIIDSAKVQQVVTNLVMNGIQAMPQGGTVEVAVGKQSARRPGTNGSPDGAVRCNFIRVSDQGSGIPPEVLPHIFEPFFTTKDIGEGSGLGLSVTYGIVREHDGWIDVDSEPGKGTRLTVYLPEGDQPDARQSVDRR